MMNDGMQQLTIRLTPETLSDLERVVVVLQKDAPVGVRYTRTDALRTVIMRGIASYVTPGGEDDPKKKTTKKSSR